MSVFTEKYFLYTSSPIDYKKNVDEAMENRNGMVENKKQHMKTDR